ncbi:hypothetical protein D1953_19905 [Peribacillus asahii]|uniref:Uncharacterized protein n=1 Tax=Peribacillus asahii TaxID=228899 RepID=A0A398AVL5_9BACI|nr:hypothetical protein [Peribacillus asahii]RID81707.1 hypothetical protein D1953_19905 [Peribacillus asahii]
MPRDDENIHVEATPHFDGKRESIINDPTASASSTMGIFDTKKEFAQEKNPFNYTPKQDPEMERFEKLMRGKKAEE